MGEKKVNSGALAWQRLKKSVSETEPKDLVKFIVIAACVFLVYVQMISCYKKLNNPAITTHTELKKNETMEYPAITICREPPFDRITKLRSSVHLTLGKCFTVEPLSYTKVVGKKGGFNIIVNHDLYDYKPLYDDVPGWNIYFHQAREYFSENNEILTGREDHLFLRVNEEVEVNLDVMQFTNIKNCNNSYNYSSSLCEALCWADSIQKEVNCTGPWIPKLNPGELPECDNYPDMSVLYRKTVLMNFLNCCLPHCSTNLFKASVVSRSVRSGNNQSRIYVYYTTKALLTMEERYAYDWNAFLADLGGSLGFLLGLSVIGVVSFLEEIVKLIWWRKRDKIPNTVKKGEVIAPYDSVYKWRFATPFKVSPIVAKMDRF